MSYLPEELAGRRPIKVPVSSVVAQGYSVVKESMPNDFVLRLFEYYIYICVYLCIYSSRVLQCSSM